MLSSIEKGFNRNPFFIGLRKWTLVIFLMKA